MGHDRRGPYWFQELPAEQVREPTRRVVTKMLAFVRRELKLCPVRIRWFRPRRGAVPWGHIGHDHSRSLRALNQDATKGTQGYAVYRPKGEREVWIRATVRPFTAAIMVAHEARHLWQFQREVSRPARELERDARVYPWRSGIFRHALALDETEWRRRMNREAGKGAR